MGWTGFGHINTSLSSFIESEQFSSELSERAIVAVERKEEWIRRMLRRVFDVQCADGSACVVVAEWEGGLESPMWLFKTMPAHHYRPTFVHGEGAQERNKINDPLASLRAYQNEHCGMCYQKMDAPDVDHDHTTGFVRGLLCRSCNLKERRGYDAAAQAYRDHPPAAAIGLMVVYGKHQPRLHISPPPLPLCGAIPGFGCRECNPEDYERLDSGDPELKALMWEALETHIPDLD